MHDYLASKTPVYFKTHSTNHELSLRNGNILTLKFVIIDAPKNKEDKPRCQCIVITCLHDRKGYCVNFGHY